MLTKALAVVMLLMILSSLGMGLFYLLKDRGQSQRSVKALTLRIALSVGLFVLFLIGVLSGLISPHGLAPHP